MTETQFETLEALFVSMPSTRQPIRMSRQRAEMYCNRIGKQFDAWARRHGIQIFQTGAGPEFYTHELAVGLVNDYRDGSQVN